ncbi:MAG: hypothetical protein Q7S61_00965 [bacterium]|nr:hypothetical protein [bacterium]
MSNTGEQPKRSPDSLPVNEVTIKVTHQRSRAGKCSLEGKEIEITFNQNSFGSLNTDPRTQCPECHIALI